MATGDVLERSIQFLVFGLSRLWIHGGEHQILPESWEADAGIPDSSRTTPTSGLVACVSPEGERLGTILPPPVLFCTGVCWSHCPGGELWESEQERDDAE